MLFLRRCWAVLFLSFLAGCTAKQNPEPIQVAHLLPLTGPDKKAATGARHGMSLALEAINAEDRRIAGRTVVIRYIDTRDDIELVQPEAVRLVTLNKVAAFIAGLHSQEAERLVRTAQPYEVPVVVPCDFPPGTGLEDFVTLEVPPARRGEVLARYATEKLKPKRTIVLTDQRSPCAVAVAAGYVQEYRRVGGSLEEWPFRNDTEQIDFAARLAKEGAAVALFAGSPVDLLKLQGQLREMKATATLLYGGEDMGSSVFQKAGVEVMMATVFAPEGLTEEGHKFAKRYEERFHEPPTFEAAQAYDAARLLFDTMHELKSDNPKKVREKLTRLENFESLTGKVTWKDRKVQRPVFVVRIVDREAKLIHTAGPDEK